MEMRELIMERILFSFNDEDLMKFFQVTVNDLVELSDFDLLEVYEEGIDIMLGLSEIPGAPWSAGKPPNE